MYSTYEAFIPPLQYESYPSSMRATPPGAYFQRTATQLKRLEKASTGPLFSLYGETFRGVTSIRAFDRRAAFEALFIRRQY